MVAAAAREYVGNHEEILTGEMGELIPPNSVHGRVLDIIKKVCA